MVQLSINSLLALGWLWVPFLLAAEVASGQSDIVCSKTDPKDCYPRIFVPTEDFQDIREGQDIPPNLHVRLNIYTGQKEARLNVPMKDEGPSPLDGLPTEQSIVIVDPPSEIEAELAAEKPVIPPNAPVYESAGKIVPPPPTGDDMTSFSKAMVMLQMDGRLFDTGLDDLVELSHDIYYGVEIIKDGPVFEKLICLLLGSGSERYAAKEKQRDHKAATILYSALQNNPTALSEAESFWKLAVNPTCGADTTTPPSKSDFISRLQSKLGSERDPATLKAKVSAISGLLKVPKFQEYFLEKQGMELLLAIFLKKGEKWDGVKQKVSQLVTDNFLDEGMGAQTGVWPKGKRSDDEICQTRGKMLGDGCWEHHVEVYGKASGGKEWPGEFLAFFQEARGGKPREKEL